MSSIKFSKRLDRFPEYIFSRLAHEVIRVQKETGRKVLSFGAGSPDVRPSKIYISKLHEFIDEPHSHMYPGYRAIPEFQDAMIEWYQTRFNVSIDAHELLPLLGGKDATSHLPLALLDEGDEVLIPDPGYMGFAGPTLLFGAKPVYYSLPEERGFKIDLAELESKVSERTKCIWINFPSNPTGQVATKEELEPIVQFALKHNIVLIYDNAYSEVTFDGFVAPSILEIPEAREIAVEIGSFSKMSSFAGFRMGWIVGNREVIKAMTKIKSQMDSGLSLPLQHLGAYALTNPDTEWHTEMIENYKSRREVIAEKLNTLGLTFSLPKGGLYIWAKIPDAERNSEEFSLQLLQNKQILLTPGTAFGPGGERYVRVSICVNIDRIGEYL